MKKHAFNLIEITIALGVVAVGIVAVIGAFPLAASKMRDAMAESYSAESATQLMAFLENALRRNDNAAWTGTPPLSLPTSKPSANYAAGTVQTGTAGSVYRSASGVYRIIRYVDKGGTDGQYDDGTDILDFEAMMVVWADQVSTNGSNALPYSFAVKLNAEVSWPATVPYAQREKAFYTTDLFKR